jgi:hypothetical protein
VPRMCATDLVCNGLTAMWDAVAVAIGHMNADSAGVAATTYFFTDGDENDSRKFGKSRVNEMIADNKKRNPMHSVLFIGSDPSARRNAEGMGLDRVHSIQHDSANTPVAYEVCRRALGRCVSGDTQSTEFNQDDIVLMTSSCPKRRPPRVVTPVHQPGPLPQPQPQPQSRCLIRNYAMMTTTHLRPTILPVFIIELLKSNQNKSNTSQTNSK